MKIKVGDKPLTDDIARTWAIGDALAGAVQLSADANQGWKRDDAIAFARGASEALDFLEQPVRARDVEGMAIVARAAACALAADEGLHSAEDVRRHHACGAAHGGSIKMIKLGGVTRALEAAQLFAELGLHANLAGKTAESSVSSAAVLHLAAAVPNLDWGVSPTTPYLAVDVVRNPIQIRDGHVAPPAGPGLGVEVDEDALARYARPV
jgi:L-alanine-DL-glutamate epimerase-like enolase superfamily enzyme